MLKNKGIHPSLIMAIEIILALTTDPHSLDVAANLVNNLEEQGKEALQLLNFQLSSSFLPR